jgi:hypothetical protein
MDWFVQRRDETRQDVEPDEREAGKGWSFKPVVEKTIAGRRKIGQQE